VRRSVLASVLVALLATVAACGRSSRTAAPPTTPAASTAAAPSIAASTTTSSNSACALQAEANTAAAGDIPDNQVFLVFHNTSAGYTMKYPEGWAQRGSGNDVVFRDKNNVVRIVTGSGPPPTAATVGRELRRLHGVRVIAASRRVPLAAGHASKVVYSTESAPNAVTGKRVTLDVDRYYLWHSGRRAVVDLGTPQGVDNVDAYRLMIESFRWR